MTLDEAIKHAEEVAEEKERDKDVRKIHLDNRYSVNNYVHYQKACKCAEEHRQLANWLKELKQLREQVRWIPIKTRSLTNKEKEEYADLGYSEDSIDSMYDCPLPNDGEEVLITTRYDEVTTDTFYRDEGCYFETYCDKDDVKAWMSKPTPYKGESGDEK